MSTRLENLRRIVKAHAEASDRVVVVGAPDRARGDGMTQGQLLAIHEFGAPSQGIPARPVLQTALRASADALKARMTRDIQPFLEGKQTLNWVLRRAGLFMEGEVKKTFGTRVFLGRYVPLAPATIEAKGSSAPLIDTGSLRASIISKIERAGGIQ